MNLLLDTHIFIWWADQPEKLSNAVLSALEDEANELLLSVASVWEMQIKIQLGKLKVRLPLKELVKNQQETNDLTVSPVTLTHVLAVGDLPFHHKDPFDQSPRSVAPHFLISHFRGNLWPICGQDSQHSTGRR
jgi:PIN domain nuclease of toxin-antitoxin system